MTTPRTSIPFSSPVFTFHPPFTPPKKATPPLLRHRKGSLPQLSPPLSQCPDPPNPCIIDSTSPSYPPADVSDILFSPPPRQKWSITTTNHTEGSCIFPLIEQFANEPVLLSHARDQHVGFCEGLERLKVYAEEMRGKPEAHRTETLQEIIKGFKGSLVEHLIEEIREILALERLDSERSMKC